MAVVSFRVKNTHKKKPAFFCFKFLNVVYFLLHWVFVTVCRVSLIVASEGSSAVRRLLIAVASLVWSTGSRRTGSVVVAHRLSRPMACGIFPDQGSNPCPLHWQVDALSPDHQGSPEKPVFCNLVSDIQANTSVFSSSEADQQVLPTLEGRGDPGVWIPGGEISGGHLEATSCSWSSCSLCVVKWRGVELTFQVSFCNSKLYLVIFNAVKGKSVFELVGAHSKAHLFS